MQGDKTVALWRGIAKGDTIKVRGERSKFIFQSARLDGENCLWFSASYHPTTKRSGIRTFSADRIQDLSMVL